MKKILCLAVLPALFLSCVSSPSDQASTTPGAGASKSSGTVKVGPVFLEKKSVTYFSDGSIDEYSLSEYDQNGNLTLRTSFSASGAVLGKEQYAYLDGKLASLITRDGGDIEQSRNTYRYDAEGRLILESFEDSAGKTISSFAYTYNPQGKKASWTVINTAGAVVAKTLYSYESSRLVAAELQDASGNKIGYSKYDYNGEGKLSRQVFYDAKGNMIRTETSTWDKGLLVREEKSNARGVSQSSTVYHYGANNEIIQKTVTDKSGKTYSKDFEYLSR